MGESVNLQNYHKVWKFDNGYGASVICREQMDGTSMDSYGAKWGMFELGVYHGDGLCARTNVLEGHDHAIRGWLDFGTVAILLNHIEALPRLDRCSHQRAERD